MSTYTILPLRGKDLGNFRVPFVCAVTPFPKGVPEPPIFPLTYEKWAKCARCHAFAYYKCIICPQRDQSNRVCWLCGVCNYKNAFDENYPNVHDYELSKLPVLDCYVPTPATKQKKFKLQSTTVKRHLLIIEHSDVTCSNGIFSSTIEKLKDTVKSLDRGEFTVMIYNKNLQFPLINIEKEIFSFQSYCDLDNSEFPPYDSLFFDIKYQKSLFMCYLDYLLTLKPSYPNINLFRLINTIFDFMSKASITTVFVISQVNIGNSEDYKNFGLKALQNDVAFDFICVTPDQSTLDYSALVDYAMLTNCNITMKSLSQSHIIPIEIINHLFTPRRLQPIAVICIPREFEVVDIQGCGLRKSPNSFVLTSLAPGDTIYFYLNYNAVSSQLEPSLQFQIKYYDTNGRKFIRTIMINFLVADQMKTIYEGVNLTAYLSSCITNAISKAREKNQLNNIEQHITANTITNKFSKMFFLNLDYSEQRKVLNGIASAKILLNHYSAMTVFGKSPKDVTMFVAPLAYNFSLTTSPLDGSGPFYLPGYELTNGALYIKLYNGIGAILLYRSEDYTEWVKAVETSPVNDFIASICTETVLEILHPNVSGNNLLFQHIMKCISTQSPETWYYSVR